MGRYPYAQGCIPTSKARNGHAVDFAMCQRNSDLSQPYFRAALSPEHVTEGFCSLAMSLPGFGFSSAPSSCRCWWISLCCSSITASSFACWSRSCLCCTCCSLITCSSTLWSSSFAGPASGKGEKERGNKTSVTQSPQKSCQLWMGCRGSPWQEDPTPQTLPGDREGRWKRMA